MIGILFSPHHFENENHSQYQPDWMGQDFQVIDFNYGIAQTEINYGFEIEINYGLRNPLLLLPLGWSFAK